MNTCCLPPHAVFTDNTRHIVLFQSPFCLYPDNSSKRTDISNPLLGAQDDKGSSLAMRPWGLLLADTGRSQY